MADLTQIFSQGGVPFTVATPYAPRFKNLIDALEAGGYPLYANQSGGYNPRNIAGTSTPSQHAFGRAIDVNWNDNPRGGNQPAIPADLARNLASQYGFTWGGDWKNPDPMHFEINPNWQQPAQGGSAAAQNAPNASGVMALGRPQPDQKPMPQGQGILSAPQTPDESEYAQQLKGILGNLGNDQFSQALLALGAGIAGNSQRGWGAGIGAGLQGAQQALGQNTQNRMSLLEALANEHARQQQLALQQAQLRQQYELQNRPELADIAPGPMGPIKGWVNRNAQTVTPLQPTSGALGAGDPSQFPQEILNQAKQVAEYRRAPINNPRPGSQGAAIMDAVGSLYPDYDATQYAQRVRTRQSWGAGGQASNAYQAIDRASRHAEELAGAIDNLGNWNGLPIANSVANPVGSMLSSNTQTKVNQVKEKLQAVATELMKSFRGTGVGSEKEIEDWKNSFDPNASNQSQRQWLATGMAMLHDQKLALMNARSEGLSPVEAANAPKGDAEQEARMGLVQNWANGKDTYANVKKAAQNPVPIPPAPPSVPGAPTAQTTIPQGAIVAKNSMGHTIWSMSGKKNDWHEAP